MTTTSPPVSRGELDDEEEPPVEAQRFSPEEEARLLGDSNSLKAQANKFFTSTRYSEAIGEYDKALASCPSYLEYECAVLRSNIAACHLKLEDWKAAVEAATASLEALDRLRPKEIPAHTEGKAEKEPETVVEIEGDGEDAERELAELQLSDQRQEDIRRIRAKALMRRAKAKMEQNGWGNLAAAEEDYKELSKMSNLPAQDQKIVRNALATLPARINAAKEKEMGEMMGKLKELGNGILKPFGLSTDMFKMNKDETTGGYNLSFDQKR